MPKNGNQGDGGGRPIAVLSSQDVIDLQALASVLTKAQLSDYFGVSENTFREIEKRQPEVSEAYKKGRAKQIASMGMNLVRMAKGGNVAANIFYLKTQAGWKEDQQEIQPQPISISIVNPHE